MTIAVMTLMGALSSNELPGCTLHSVSILANMHIPVQELLSHEILAWYRFQISLARCRHSTSG